MLTLFCLEQFHHLKNVQVGLSCWGLHSAVPPFEVVICGWTIKPVDIPLTEAKIAIKPCPLKITHKVIIILAILPPQVLLYLKAMELLSSSKLCSPKAY